MRSGYRQGGRIILGAMSGTSADGVDIAAVQIAGRGEKMRAKLLGHHSIAFSPQLRQAIQTIRSAGHCSLADLAAMGHDLTLVYARASLGMMRRLGLTPREVSCIAAHGQTLFHAPPLTIQWFDPALLAAKTGCPVVSDFRRADCAVGGQGAPLVPFADYILFRDRQRSRVLLNIGGIANITYLPAGGGLDSVIAFDTGPGNCLSDAIARKRLKKSYDAGGRVAAKGNPNERAVDGFLRDAYFRRKYPKSTDGPAMAVAFERAIRGRRIATDDLLATACLCCARGIARGVESLKGKVDEIIVAGGGMKNATMARMLAGEAGLPIRSTAEFGVPIEAREAMAFALLAAATLDGQPSNVPSVTGAARPTILGSITPANR